MAGAREALTQPRADDAASLDDGPLGEADIADDELGQFIRTPEEIELLGLLRSHLLRQEQAEDDDHPEPAPSTDPVDP